MEINWGGITCLILAIIAIVIIVRMRHKVALFLGTMGQIGPGNNPDDKILGLIAFGLIVLLIVGIVKILASRRD